MIERGDINASVYRANNFYPIAHWSLTIATGPLFLILFDFIQGNPVSDIAELYSIFVFYGLFFSLPALVFYAIVFYTQVKKDFSDINLKILLILTTVGTIFCTFFVLASNINGAFLYILSGYAMPAIIFGLLLKPRLKQN